MDLIARLESFSSKKGILFMAIEAFKNPETIKIFYREYVVYIQKHRESLAEKDPSLLYLVSNSEEAAIKNIVYILGFYEKKISDRWRESLPEIEPFYKEFHKPYSRKNEKVDE